MPKDNTVVPMGTIVGAFGIKGWVIIKPDTSSPDGLVQYKKIQLLQDGEWSEPYTILNFIVKDNVLYAQLTNINDRTHALSLKRTTIGVPRSSFPKPDPNEYYWVDLIGLFVYNHTDVQNPLGVVADLMDTGANSVLVVKPLLAGNNILIPFVDKHITSVSLEQKQIIVDWSLLN